MSRSHTRRRHPGTHKARSWRRHAAKYRKRVLAKGSPAQRQTLDAAPWPFNVMLAMSIHAVELQMAYAKLADAVIFRQLATEIVVPMSPVEV